MSNKNIAISICSNTLLLLPFYKPPSSLVKLDRSAMLMHYCTITVKLSDHCYAAFHINGSPTFLLYHQLIRCCYDQQTSKLTQPQTKIIYSPVNQLELITCQLNHHGISQQSTNSIPISNKNILFVADMLGSTIQSTQPLVD